MNFRRTIIYIAFRQRAVSRMPAAFRRGIISSGQRTRVNKTKALSHSILVSEMTYNNCLERKVKQGLLTYLLTVAFCPFIGSVLLSSLSTCLLYLYRYFVCSSRQACDVLRSACLCVCLYVCIPVSSHISKPTRPNFTKLSIHVNCSRGSDCSEDNAIRYVLPVL